ncbi:hypothetical protein ACT3R7_11695 [Halomonas sp. AOP43-A1-21]
MNLTAEQMAAIGTSVNKPRSTMYRWRNDNPELFQAAYEYASKRGLVPPSDNQIDRAYQEGVKAAGYAGISDCPYVTSGMNELDHKLSDAWIAGLHDGANALHDTYLSRAKTIVDNQAYQFGTQPQAFFDGMVSAIATRLKMLDGCGALLESYPATVGQEGWQDGLRVGNGVKLNLGESTPKGAE